MTTFRRLPWILAATLLLGSSLAARAEPVSKCQGVSVGRVKGWSTIASPEFALAPLNSGDGTIFHEDTKRTNFYAVDPVDPDRIFVGNHYSVFRTDDGGCDWKRVFGIPTPPESPQELCDQAPGPERYLAMGCGRIYSIDIGPTEQTHNRIFVQAEVGQFVTGQAVRSFVYRSDDGGETWSTLNGPLSTGGSLPTLGMGDLVIAPGQPDTVYLFRSFTQHIDVFVSKDAGESWEERKPSFGATGLTPTWRIEPAVNPQNADELWGSVFPGTPNKSGLYHSTDGARSWTLVGDLFQKEKEILDIATYLPAKGPTYIAVGTDTEIVLSTDGGSTWRPVPVAFAQEGFGLGSMAFGRGGRYLVIANKPTLVTRYDLRRKVGTVLNEAAWGEGVADGEWQQSIVHTPGGFFLLVSCFSPGDYGQCARIARYQGRGV